MNDAYPEIAIDPDIAVWLDRVVDGDLARKRFETEDFVVHAFVDHSLTRHGGGIVAVPEKLGVGVTNKRTGGGDFRAVGLSAPGDAGRVRVHWMAFLDAAERGDQAAMIKLGRGLFPFVLTERKTHLLFGLEAPITNIKALSGLGSLFGAPRGSDESSSRLGRLSLLDEALADAERDQLERHYRLRRERAVRQMMDDVALTAMTASCLANEAKADTSWREVESCLAPYCPAVTQAFIGRREWDWFQDISSDVFRNRAQLLERLAGQPEALGTLLFDSRIREGIDRGAPFREAMAHLPLANHSKRTIQRLVHNITQLSSTTVPGEHHFCLEKETSSEEALLAFRRMRGLHLGLACMLVSLPEASYARPGSVEGRTGMLRPMSRIDGVWLAWERAVRRHRDGEESFKSSLGWMARIQNEEQARYYENQVSDAIDIIENTYLQGVLNHIALRHFGHMATIHSVMSYGPGEILPEDSALLSMNRTRNFNHVLDAAEQVHRDLQALFLVGRPDTDISWQPAISGPFAHGEYSIVPIHDVLALKEEGQALNHCAGTYTRAAMDGHSFLFSVRYRGERVSTLEIGMDDDEAPFHVRQHFAKSNSLPPEGAVAAVEALRQAWLDGTVAFNTDTRVSREALAALPDVEQEELELGVRFSDRDVVLLMVEQMQATLPHYDLWRGLRCALPQAEEEIIALQRAYEQRQQYTTGPPSSRPSV